MVNTDERQKFTRQGLTFDDVLLIPAESASCPRPSRAESTASGVSATLPQKRLAAKSTASRTARMP